MSDHFTGTRDRVSAFYQVAFGQINLPLGKKEPDNMEGVTKRVNKNNETVYEIRSDYIRGKIIGLKLKQPPEKNPEFGETIVVTLLLKGKKCNLDIPFDSAYGRGFFYAIEGVDPNEELEFEPWTYHDQKAGRDKMGLSLYQFGSKIEWTYGTKKNPGKVPKLKEVVFKGKTQYDNTDQLAFFREKMEELIDLFSPGEEEISTDLPEVEVHEPETVQQAAEDEDDNGVDF